MAAEKTYLAIDLDPQGSELGAKSPLHVTLTPPVGVEEEKMPGLIVNLQTMFETVAPFEIVGGDNDTFGPKESPVEVRKIVPNPDLEAVHSLALRAMQEVAPAIDTTYTHLGQGYQPHSTYINRIGLGEGERRTVDAVTLLRKRGAEWVRLAEISLGLEQ